MTGLDSSGQSIEARKLFSGVHIEAKVSDQKPEGTEVAFLGCEYEERLDEGLGRVEFGQIGRTDGASGLDLVGHVAECRLKMITGLR